MFSSKKFHAFQNLVLELLNSSFKLKVALVFFCKGPVKLIQLVKIPGVPKKKRNMFDIL